MGRRNNRTEWEEIRKRGRRIRERRQIAIKEFRARKCDSARHSIKNCDFQPCGGKYGGPTSEKKIVKTAVTEVRAGRALWEFSFEGRRILRE